MEPATAADMTGPATPGGAHILVDGHHRIREHDAAFAELVALPARDVRGHTFGELVRCINLVVENEPCGLTSKCPWCPFAQAVARTIQQGERVGPITLERVVVAGDAAVDRAFRIVCAPDVVGGETMARVEIEEITAR